MSDRSAPAPCPARSAYGRGGIAPDGHGRGGRARLYRSGAFSRRPHAARPRRPRRRQSHARSPIRPGRAVEEAAASILELATEHMVQAILDITLNQGIDPATAAFVAGGGAAGLNCVAIGRRLGCRAGLCAGDRRGARGRRRADLRSDLASSGDAPHDQRVASISTASTRCSNGLESALPRLPERRPGAEAEFVAIDWTTEARYPDQAWEIEVPLRRRRFDGPGDVERSRCRFPCSPQGHFRRQRSASRRSRPSAGARRSAVASARRARAVCAQASRGGAARGRRVYFRATRLDRRRRCIRFETLPPDVVVEGPGDRRIEFHLDRHRSRRHARARIRAGMPRHRRCGQ